MSLDTEDLKSKKSIKDLMRKKDLRQNYWVVFFISLIITIVSISTGETISFTIFALITFFMAILSEKIINIIWKGIQ